MGNTGGEVVATLIEWMDGKGVYDDSGVRP